MKAEVLVVSSVFPRWEGDAAPPFVQNLCELMAKDGWEIHVLLPHAAEARFREQVNGLQVTRFPYFFPLGLQTLCYGGGILINLRNRPWTRLLLPFFFCSQIIALFYLCLRRRPDLIHSHSLLPQGLSVALVARLFRIPHVTTSHGNDVFGLKPTGLMGRLKRYVLASADAITVNSSATRNAVENLDADPSKISLIPAVANEGEVQADLLNEIKTKYEPSRILLFVGRLIEEKGILELLRAFAILSKEDTHLHCLIVGDGPLKPEAEQLAGTLEINSKIEFLGWRPREEIPSWMSAADLLIVPSRETNGWQEAQGLVVVEAMAVGTPIVASRLGGIPDMVIDGETGFLFDPNSTNGLLEAMRKALSSDLGPQIRLSQKELYSSKFKGSVIAKTTSELYESLRNHS